jgi:DNA-binding response OmpR family regulator
MLRALVVDDDRLVRDIACHALGLLGVDALGTGDVRTAVQMADDEALGLILLDLGVARPAVAEMVARLRAGHPGLPILLWSGSTRGSVPPAVLASPGVGWLGKPFSLGQLRDALHTLGVLVPA